MSFHTILLVQSADVVGNRRMLDILYNPIPKKTRLSAIKMSLGICKSTSENLEKAWSMPKIAVMGVRMAIDVTLIENMLS